MAYNNECCFCWTYKKGAVILGCIGTAIMVLAILALTSLTFDGTDEQNAEYTKEDYALTLVSMLITIACHLLLIYGALKSRAIYLWPYLILSAIEVITCIIQVFYIIIGETTIRETLLTPVGILLFSYFFYCMLCLYKRIRAEESEQSDPNQRSVCGFLV